MATKLCRVLMYGEAKSILKLLNSDHMIARGHVSDSKLNVSSSTRPIPPGRVVTYDDRKPPLASYDSLTTQSCKDT